MDPEMTVVLPGDVLFDLNSVDTSSGKIIAGPGLRREGAEIRVTKCGLVCKNKKRNYFIDYHQKRYVPVRGENVVGVVLKKNIESVIVDIGSSEPATLSLLAFENATKRNKPLIKVGDAIYARISVACKDMEPELVCINSYGESKGLGILDEHGFMFSVPLEVSRKLLLPKKTLLQRLGKTIPYEIVVGLNGRIWVKAKNTNQALVIVQAINLLEHMTEEEAGEAFDQMFEYVVLS